MRLSSCPGARGGNPDPARSSTRFTGMAEKILIVDDEPRIREVLMRFLAPEGYNPRRAESGEEALEAGRAQPPGLVRLQLRLPGAVRLPGCPRLKENPHTAPD